MTEKTKKEETKPKAEKKIEKAKVEKPKRSLFKREKKLKEESKVPQTGQPVASEPFDVIKFVVMTEKAIQLIERQNKLVFVVDRNAEKKDIKKAVENAFSANVSNVQTMIDQLGRKKAFVRFAKAGEAGEIAIKLGII